MKLAAVLLSMLVVAHAAEIKRQINVLSLALPSITKLLVDKLGLDKLIGRFVGQVGELLSGKKGQIPLEGTQLVLDYDMGKCHLHGKRWLIHITEECTATVCENKVTHTCKSCKKGHQQDALKCALMLEIDEIQKLAEQAKG